MDTANNGIILILGLLGIALLFQRWFWTLVFGIGTLASAFSCLASIFHFQILGALGFFFLAFFLFALTVAVADG